ncbi:hypothetical protein Tsubulata_024347 [Turnera subulata]|uniref:Late embryogenesis abundant protein LEA-2 subgroup domain-containing protein n=1 Tax=Turnera subulata TaxID=218843 RepID=A0A9Q0JKA5_9ROSI|nr:hypothetical protein Tsubulata_024347 [Turnera subulata]
MKNFVIGVRIVASGTIHPGEIKANDTTVHSVPLKVPYDVMVNLVSDINAADWDIDYEVELGLGIGLPVGKIKIPLKKNGEIQLPPICIVGVIKLLV